ncbi:hypothetical protein FAGAP_1529 [Fusarium agapanthi]|uniref:BTB domain-containing protein n=1 Tax=Fusarium agapanthi TaxID=1803897 RepID=A0A9P5BHM9_9HYPO|nr:hypothetical protein FAGAP_1529 [Fusarium agapanthi]
MKKSLLELDPQADALLILRCPNLQHVREPTCQEAAAKKKNVEDNSSKKQGTDTMKAPETNGEMALLQPYLRNGDPNQIEFRVSAKHLCLASPVFRKMIQGEFQESKPNSEGLLEICASEWNAEALLIVLDVLHNHHYNVPKRLSEDTIAQIGLIVDYYDCLEAVQIFFDPWDTGIGGWMGYSFWSYRESLAEDFGDDKTLLLFIAWAFRSKTTFKGLTSSAILNTQGLIETHLPIPAQLLERINNQRVELLDQLFSQLYSLQEDLIVGRVGCSLECSCRLLGYLMKQMKEKGLPNKRPKKPFAGYSVVSLAKTIGSIETPNWQGLKLLDRCKLKKSLGLYQDEKELGIAVPGLILEGFQ